MCLSPKPINEFGKRIMDHIVNQQFDLVNEEIKRFKNKGYVIYYKIISREEHESAHFIENAGKIMQEAKKRSRGGYYQGVNAFYPFIRAEQLKRFYSLKRRPPFFEVSDLLVKWSMRFNENSCLNSVFVNQGKARCEDTNIYLMAFYYKGKN